MKRTLLALIAYVLGYCAFAELPQSVDEVLFGICGGTNYEDYVQWLRTDGTMVFERPFVMFDRAQFRMHYPTNDFAPRHYSIEMEREFPGKPSSTNLVGLIQKAESILLKSFRGRKFKRQYDGTSYQSSCKDIDGRGWDAYFSVGLCRTTAKPLMLPRQGSSTRFIAKGDSCPVRILQMPGSLRRVCLRSSQYLSTLVGGTFR